MIIKKDAKFKTIGKELARLEKVTKETQGVSTGGFLDKKVERRFRYAVDTWKKNVVGNKQNHNVIFINNITIGTDGDISKEKEFFTSMNAHMKSIDGMLKEFKGDKDITDSSFLTMFSNIYSMLTSAKYANAFKLAYATNKKNKKNASLASVSDMFIMSHQILVSFAYYSMGTINIEINELYNFYDAMKDKESFKISLEDLQNKYNSFIHDLGFVTLYIHSLFSSMKNPSDEIRKAISVESDARNKIAKSIESKDDYATKQNLFYELSEEAYLVNTAGDFTRGKEDALLLACIAVGSIIGLILSIKLIRRAIYMIGTIKTDIREYVLIDVATINMNIKMLKEEMEKTTDEKKRKEIAKIIEKQERWVEKANRVFTDIKEEVNVASSEADYVIEAEDDEGDKYDETAYDNDEPGFTSTPYDSDDEILM
ncbi:MAG: hypothetical protein ACRC5M_04630 [Anaeroplasmataceae bacterium]